MKPLKKNVTKDQALTNISVKYSNDNFIAESILPVVNVGQDTGTYYKYDKSHLRITEALRAPGSGTKQAESGMAAEGTYDINERALKDIVPDEIQAQADSPLNPRVDATEDLTERIMLIKESELSTYMASTGNISQNTTLSGTDQWSDYANSDPVGDVKTAKQTVEDSIGKEPNTLVLGKATYRQLLDHPDVIDRIKYSQFGTASEDLLGRLFDLDNVVVGSSFYNDSDEGGTDDLSKIWGKNAWVLYSEPNPSLKSVSFGYYFKNGSRGVDRWRDEDRKGTWVRVSDRWDRGIVASSAAYLVKSAVA